MTRVRVLPGPLNGRARAPPSKSYTHRALVVGALSGRRFLVESPLDSDDTRATVSGLRALGMSVEDTRKGWEIEPRRPGSKGPPRVVRCRSSGTTLRFLLPVAARDAAVTRFAGSAQLLGRPIDSLANSLREMGAGIDRVLPSQALPLRVKGPIRGGRTHVDVDSSSQFLSGLLMTLPALEDPSEVYWRTLPVSWTYVESTLAVLRAHGISVRLDRVRRRASIDGGQRPTGTRFRVPGDASSAAYLWAGAAVTGGDVSVSGVPSDWPQADLRLLGVLRQMGARVSVSSNGARVVGPIRSPVRVDLTDSPDLYPLVGTLACSVVGRSVLKGAPQAAVKESDRRAATRGLVRAFGARPMERPGRLEILGQGRLNPIGRPLPDDHRIVMSAAVGALASTGPSRIEPAGAVRKSYPGFWSAIEALGARFGGAT